MSPAISQKGQVTIPKHIRERLAIKAYDFVSFVPHPDGRVVVEVRKGVVHELRGMVKLEGKCS